MEWHMEVAWFLLLPLWINLYPSTHSAMLILSQHLSTFVQQKQTSPTNHYWEQTLGFYVLSAAIVEGCILT